MAIGGNGAADRLCPLPSLSMPLGSTWTCGSHRAGTDLNRPIGDHVPAELVSKNLFYFLLHCAMVPGQTTVCSRGQVSGTAPCRPIEVMMGGLCLPHEHHLLQWSTATAKSLLPVYLTFANPPIKRGQS